MDLDPNAQIPVSNTGRQIIRAGDKLLVPGATVHVDPAWIAHYGALPNLHVDYSAFADQLRSHTDDGIPQFDLWIPLSAVDGYGRHALDLWRGFLEIGTSPLIRSVGLEDDVFLNPSVLSEAHTNQLRPPSKVSLCFSIPRDEHHHRTGSLHHIAMTQFETNHVPVKHIENVNLADHLVVTSKFQPRIWRESGATLPISVMTPGIDTETYAERGRTRDGFFKVLMIGALSSRKNPIAALRIFLAASQGDPRWRLTVKSRGYHNNPVTHRLREMCARDGRITFDFGDAPPWKVLDFYYAHDCLLWPSKGEGVGLPPLEAMSTGMEVVISDNSGMSDYVHKNHCYPIRTAGKEPADTDTYPSDYIASFGGVGEWWVPDENHAVKQLRRCYEDWSAGNGKGAKAARYVREHHTLAHQAESVLKAMETYL